MHKITKFLTILSLFFTSSCAYLFNDKNVDLSISSNPPGANIFIEGKNYGQTPKILNIEPKNYDVTLRLPGHGSANFKLKTWQTIRAKESEGARCLADSLGFVFVLPILSMWSVYCRDFKEKDHLITIPPNESSFARPFANNSDITNQSSMIGNQFNPYNQGNYQDPYQKPHYQHQETYNPYNQEPMAPNYNFQAPPAQQPTVPYPGQGQMMQPMPNIGPESLGQNLYRDSYRESPQRNLPNRPPPMPPYMMQQNSPQNQINNMQQPNPQMIEEMYKRDMQRKQPPQYDDIRKSY